MAIDLPTMPNTVPQVRAPESRVSPGQIASPYLEFANTIERGAKEVSDISKLLANEEGLKSVTRGEDGNLQVERPVIVGDAALAYKHAMQTKAVVDGEDIIKTDMLAMRHEFKDNPDRFSKAAEAYKKNKVPQIAKAAGPAVGMALERIANSTGREFHEGLLNQKERLDLSRAHASIDAQIETTKNELFAIAAGGDTSSRAYTDRLEKIGALYGQLVNNPRLGIPKEKADFEIKQIEAQLFVAGSDSRLAKIQATDGPDAALKEVEKIRTDPGLNLTPGQRVGYATQLTGAIHQRMNAQNQIDKGTSTEIGSLLDIATKGNVIPPARMAAAESAAIQSGNPALVAALQNVKTIGPIIADWRKAAPAQLERNVAEVERTMADTGNKLLKNARDHIKTDPNGWADRTGAVPMAPIDFAKPETMRARIGSAETVSNLYGIAPHYLTPDEKNAIQAASAAGGKPMTDIAGAIVAGFGDRAPRVLAEISKNSPVLAHIGGLMNTQGSPAVVRDAAEAVSMLQNKDYKLPHWLNQPRDKVIAAQHGETLNSYGGAFALAQDTGRAAEATAKAAFFARANRTAGLDPLLEGSDSKAAYKRALQEAAGATYSANGTQYGGVGSYRTGILPWGGKQVLVPGNVRADRFSDVIGAIRDEDLGGKWKFGTGTFGADDIKRATPVAVRGGYRFAVGDPQSDDPKWIPDANGRPLTVDLDRLEPALRKRVPGAYAVQ